MIEKEGKHFWIYYIWPACCTVHEPARCLGGVFTSKEVDGNLGDCDGKVLAADTVMEVKTLDRECRFESCPGLLCMLPVLSKTLNCIRGSMGRRDHLIPSKSTYILSSVGGTSRKELLDRQVGMRSCVGSLSTHQ